MVFLLWSTSIVKLYMCVSLLPMPTINHKLVSIHPNLTLFAHECQSSSWATMMAHHLPVEKIENNYPAIRPVRITAHIQNLKMRLVLSEGLVKLLSLHPLPLCWSFHRALEVSLVVTPRAKVLERPQVDVLQCHLRPQEFWSCVRLG